MFEDQAYKRSMPYRNGVSDCASAACDRQRFLRCLLLRRHSCKVRQLLSTPSRGSLKLHSKGGVLMGLPNKDEIKGKFEQVKGGLKEKAGQALDDRKLQHEGQ